MRETLRTLDGVERKTLPRHIVATILESSFMAMCWSGSDIIVKGFDAGVLAVTLTTMAPGAAMVLSLAMGQPMAKIGRRRLLRVASWIGRLPLFLVMFIQGPYSFVALITLQAISQVAITTSWNSLLRTNYRDDRRGSLYSIATLFGTLASGITMVSAGRWLDINGDAYRILYPIAAVIGVIACHVFSDIDVRRGFEFEPEKGKGPRALMRTFFADRNFVRYELAFMLYGLAFMSIMTAKPLRMAGKVADGQLEFSYSVLLGSKGVFAVCMAIGTIFMGRFMDRVGPAGMAGRCFVLLILHAILLIFVDSPGMLFAAEALIGLAMGGVNIAWNLGPVTLAPTPGVASAYMQIHVAMVGVRALVGHPIGGWLSHVTGDPRWVFAMGAVLFTAATWVMVSLGRDVARQRAEASRTVDSA